MDGGRVKSPGRLKLQKNSYPPSNCQSRFAEKVATDAEDSSPRPRGAALAEIHKEGLKLFMKQGTIPAATRIGLLPEL